MNDLSTALLMMRFYANLATDSTLTITQALTAAQFWLRTVTQADLLKWIQQQENINTQHKKELQTYIETEIQKLRQIGNDNRLTEAELGEFKTKLRKLPQIGLDYANKLRYLEDYQNTILINANNYIEKVKQIQTNSQDGDVLFLKKFHQQNSTFFLNQIKYDLGYFNHGSGLLDKAIAAIRGRLAIDQAELERDRQEALRRKETEDKLKAQAQKAKDKEREFQLQINILAVGSGIGASSILASSYPLISQENPLIPASPLLPTPHPFLQSIFWSLLFGFGVGGLIWGLPRVLQWLRKQQRP